MIPLSAHEPATVLRTSLCPGFTLPELVSLLEAEQLSGRGAERCLAVSTDTRTLHEGDYFIALRGPSFDAHDFLTVAIERGAGGLIVNHDAGRRLLSRQRIAIPVIGVADPLMALQRMASAHRQRFTLPVVAITGSNGKTTTKEMLAAILSRRYETHKTRGNLNNEIGLPLTLMGLTAAHTAAVYELGISRWGELTRLCDMATPTIGLITNIGLAHIESLGDLEGVRSAKAELLDRLPADGVAVLNRDDESYGWLRSHCRGRSVSFGVSSASDVRVVAGAIEPGDAPRQRIGLSWSGGTVDLALPVVGLHNVLNAAAATAAALQVGIAADDIAAGLESFRPPAMRSEWRQLAGGVHLLLDAYNANPISTRCALETTVQLATSGQAVAFLGDMLELGTNAVWWHQELGRQLVALGLHRLVTVGPLARSIADGAEAAGMSTEAIRRCADVGEAGALLEDWLRDGVLRAGDLVLIKGSRAVGMDQLIDHVGEPGVPGGKHRDR